MQSLRHQQAQRETVNHWTDVFFSDGKDVGFIAVLDLEKPNKPSTRYYKRQDIAQLLSDTQGKPDRYISLNSFNRFSRKGMHVNQIRAIGIDIDQYKLGLTYTDVMQEVAFLVAENKIPKPNLVIKSRGVQLFYSIHDGASVKMAWLQQYITSEIIKLLENVGADAQANDLSRVLRVPQSINSRNNSIVEPEILHRQAYTLDELRQYFPEVKRYRKSNRASNRKNVIPFQKANLSNNYAILNLNRTKDIEKLIQLRNGNLTGCRNVALYIYCFHASQSIAKLETMQAVARNAFKDVYSEDTSQTITPASEFCRTVKSAFEDGKAFQEYLQRNGYRIFKKAQDGIIKPFTTHNIISKLDITDTEQQQLTTLISPTLAYERKKARQLTKARENGVRPRAEYLNQQSTQKEKRLTLLQQTLSSNPECSNAELMAILNVSRRTLFNYLKELKA